MRRASITLVGLLLLPLAGGCGTAPSPEPPSVGAGHRHVAADVDFVRVLIPHHEEGITLARAVAKRPEARVLAEAIIATQQDEVVRMTGWLGDWSEPTPPARSAAPATGDPIKALIAHQQEAIKLAQLEQANGTNPTALAYARQVIESRAGEISQLRTYLG
jgi:uncharacterized protein (DUF305 family)